jgi:DNA replication protein DnaC
MIKENINCPCLNSCNHIDCDRFCIKRYKVEYYFDQALIFGDKRLKFPLRIDNDGSDSSVFQELSDLEKNVVNFVSKGENAYIYSQNVGNGKTSWSLRFAIAYINKTWFNQDLKPIVLFISVPRFLLELKSNISDRSSYVDHIMKNVLDCPLVIWDDIGSKNGTEFEVSHLLSIIDQRIAKNKSNVYTSNLNSEEMHQALGDRLYSRIVNYSQVYNIKGKDKRGL